jgi:hypothetical protein
MIKLLLVVDDNDNSLGEYFNKSYVDFSNFLKQKNDINESVLKNGSCNGEKVVETIKTFNDTPFIFISFSHGNEESLLTASNAIVDANNASYFNNSFFYTSACLVGRRLGQTLIDNKCRCFIGYTEEVTIMTLYEECFVICENHGVKMFCEGVKTTFESFNSMVEKYDEEIDNLLQSGNIDDIIAASTLVGNKDSLIFIGEKSLTLNDIMTAN